MARAPFPQSGYLRGPLTIFDGTSQALSGQSSYLAVCHHVSYVSYLCVVRCAEVSAVVRMLRVCLSGVQLTCFQSIAQPFYSLSLFVPSIIAGLGYVRSRPLA